MASIIIPKIFKSVNRLSIVVLQNDIVANSNVNKPIIYVVCNLIETLVFIMMDG